MKKIIGYLVAKSPIHHGGDEKTGSETLFNHQRIFVSTLGKTIDAPFISGNAIRGVWRRLIMEDFLKLVDYKPSTRLYHSLFSGGLLEEVSEKDSGTINLELKEKMIQWIIPLALFGTSYLNQTIEGRLQVGQILPICKEYADYLPDVIEKYQSLKDVHYHTFMDFHFQTRKDDLRAERKEGEQAIQMLIQYQVMTPGTVFFHEVRLLDSSSLYESTLGRILELWNQNPIIGGKSRIGFGQLEINYDLKTTSKEYLDFISKNKQKILDVLNELK